MQACSSGFKNFLSFLDSMNNIMIKQDPVMVANHKDEPLDPEDFILHDSLPLFDNRYGIVLLNLWYRFRFQL